MRITGCLFVVVVHADIRNKLLLGYQGTYIYLHSAYCMRHTASQILYNVVYIYWDFGGKIGNKDNFGHILTKCLRNGTSYALLA